MLGSGLDQTVQNLQPPRSRKIREKSVTLKAVLVLWPKVFQKSQKVAQNRQSGTKNFFPIFFSNFMPPLLFL